MSEAKEDVFLEFSESSRQQRMQWSAYATSYDAMCGYNPAYQENVETLLNCIRAWNLRDDVHVADLGAGTGNFVCALSKELPKARYTHIDCDPEMNARARRKYSELRIDVSIQENYLQTLQLEENSVDLALCVNVLYAVAPRHIVLKKIRRWLKPDGRLFIIDFGRRVGIFDWGWYLLRNAAKQHGLAHSARALLENVEIVKQNRNAKKDFSDGIFWEHSTDDFASLLVSSGFDIESVRKCYRDYCDLAICRPTFTATS